MRKKVTAQETLSVCTRIILPNDTNTLGNLMGGNLLSWLDINSAIAAHRFCKRVVVTASVNHVAFEHPIKLGDFVTIESKVSRSFNSSMEVYSDVYVDDNTKGTRQKCNEAIYTFVAVDQLGSAIEVPEIIAETELEKSRYKGALRRKQLALILAGKLNPNDATELKSLFINS